MDNGQSMSVRSVKLGIALLVVMALSLAACMPITSEGGWAPAPIDEASAEATPAATEEPTAEATEEATEEPTEEPIEEATAESGEEAGSGNGMDIAALVQENLAQQLQIDIDQIEVVSVEPVEWSDACLGVYTADMMCAQVITPGYLVIVAVDGEQYEYHTNDDGSFMQLASAPEANVGDVLISWQQTFDICQAAQFGRDGVAYGPCMGVMMSGKLAPEREAQLGDFVATYAPFEAETAAGSVTLNGLGSTEATPAEQRMIAEWAHIVTQEAAAGEADATWGLALTWHREGGIAGFCDDLSVYVTGQLDTTSCHGESDEAVGTRQMSAEELTQLYAWVDEYASFEFVQDDGNVADAMKVTLTFMGEGSTEADEATQQAIVAFAQDLYGTLSQ